MKKFLVAMVCAMGLVFTVPNALALATLDIGGASYVGSIKDGIPPNPESEVEYINNLRGLFPGALDTPIGSETYNRVDSTITPLPILITPLPPYVGEGQGTSFTAPFAGSFYLLGKYDADKAGSLVWFVNAADGAEFTLPGTYNGHEISHLNAYSNVPIPSTLLLMGSGLVGLIGIGRRRMKK